jgi:predicted anti-sigma-YlaC factor YlaD
MAKHPRTALVPFLRGELATGEHARVAQHLERCAGCRELSESLAGISADFARRLEQMPAPDLLIYRAQLARKLASQRVAKRRFPWPGFGWASVAALSASAIALILLFSFHAQPNEPSVDLLSTEYEISEAGVGLLRDYPVVTHLELLENYDVIEHLNELPEPDNQQHAART